MSQSVDLFDEAQAERVRTRPPLSQQVFQGHSRPRARQNRAAGSQGGLGAGFTGLDGRPGQTFAAAERYDVRP
jgi:hypothetical protein